MISIYRQYKLIRIKCALYLLTGLQGITTMNKQTILNLIGASFLSLLLSSCAENVNPNTYTTSEVGSASRVVSGVIVSKRAVSVDNNSGVGGLAGTATGAALGSTIGGSTAGNIAAIVGGAVIGGVAGNAIDGSINHHQGFEYIIRLQKGRTISVVQTKDEELHVNDRVLVIYGAKTRIVADSHGVG
jgi:outer membrane lipoprotein SlyB